MSLDDVASQTRIPIRHLQAYRARGVGRAARAHLRVGFARNYANAVGLDGAAIGAASFASSSAARCRSARPRPNITSRPIRRAVPPRSLGDRRRGLRCAADRRLFRLAQQLTEASRCPSAKCRPKRRRPRPLSRAAPPGRRRPARSTLTATGEVWLRDHRRPGGPVLFSGSLKPGQTYSVPATAQRPLIRTGRPQLLRASAGGRDLGPLAPEERTIDDVSLLAQDLAARAAPAPAAAAPPPPRAPRPLRLPKCRLSHCLRRPWPATRNSVRARRLRLATGESFNMIVGKRALRGGSSCVFIFLA